MKNISKKESDLNKGKALLLQLTYDELIELATSLEEELEIRRIEITDDND